MDQFLDDLTPAQFDELYALHCIEGIGFEKIQRTMALGFTAILQALGAKDIEPSHFIPGSEPQQGSPQAGVNLLAAALGKAPPNGNDR